MKKLALDLTELTVETFTISMRPGSGTVQAYSGGGATCLRVCMPEASRDIEHCGGNETAQYCFSVNNYTCNCNTNVQHCSNYCTNLTDCLCWG